MSNARGRDGATEQPDQLTDDERDLLERLADRYDGEPAGRICEIALSADTHSESREETN